MFRRRSAERDYVHSNLSAQGIEREAGQVTLRQVDLQRRFGLALQTPCAGTDLHGRCQLLRDANEAKALLPSGRTVTPQGRFSRTAKRRVGRLGSLPRA
jgi:hypothetical protein